uniref:hypothetical protein n=1 Tax=Sphingomonas bacterium TaxID=1895847 RepID=UPI002618F9DD|nr:hypothetical protein [Sphingomonas bacterium]
MNLMFLLPQWLATCSAFWLIWWAARSGDATAFKAVAIALAVVPALLMPILTTLLPQYLRVSYSYSQIGMIIGAVGAAIGISRALFLIIWASLSKDETVLRVVGWVIAGLVLACYLFALLALTWLGSLNS